MNKDYNDILNRLKEIENKIEFSENDIKDLDEIHKYVISFSYLENKVLNLMKENDKKKIHNIKNKINSLNLKKDLTEDERKELRDLYETILGECY